MRKVGRRELLLGLLFAKGSTSSTNEPLDRIRIMKGLFLLSRRVPRLDKLYDFEPYLYGAVSFQVYNELEALQRTGVISTAHEYQKESWNRYFLTRKGSVEGKLLQRAIPKKLWSEIESVKKYISSKPTYELLKEIYSKYPEFAKNSVIRFASD